MALMNVYPEPMQVNDFFQEFSGVRPGGSVAPEVILE